MTNKVIITKASIVVAMRSSSGLPVRLDGLVVEFSSLRNVFVGSVFKTYYKNLNRYFEIQELYTTDGNDLLLQAVETGYWKHHIAKSTDFDIRHLIGLEMTPVVDYATLDRLSRSKNYA